MLLTSRSWVQITASSAKFREDLGSSPAIPTFNAFKQVGEDSASFVIISSNAWMFNSYRSSTVNCRQAPCYSPSFLNFVEC